MITSWFLYHCVFIHHVIVVVVVVVVILLHFSCAYIYMLVCAACLIV
jgi:hypothetical protein